MFLAFLKEHVRLSSPLAMFLILAAAATSLWRRPASRGQRSSMVALALGYWCVATPVGAGMLVGGLGHGLAPLALAADAGGAETVVVLGGGAMTASVGGLVAGTLTPSSLLRALEAARVFKMIGGRVVVASGGIPLPGRQLRPESEMLRDALVKAGVPSDAVVEESQSKTTHEQALHIAPLLRARGIRHFVLVTSPTHMRRSLAVFRQFGFNPVPSVSPIRSEQLRPPLLLLPNDESLRLSDDAMYNYAATAYYWMRGWITLR